MAESISIWRLVALEQELQVRKLIFATMHYRAFGNFRHLPTPTYLWVSEDKVFYLTDGNHRGAWFSLHGIKEMDVEYDRRPVSSFDLFRYKTIHRENLERGIKSPVDLARMVSEEDRIHYAMKGPLLPGVTPDDLLRLDFMEKINPKLLYLL